MTARMRRRPPPALLVLGALAVAMELTLLFGWLRPLSLLRHTVNPPDGAPMVTFLGRTREGALGFAIPAAGLCLLYLAAIQTARSAAGRAAVIGSIVAAAGFALTLAPMFPGGTQDIFHNVADGRLLWLHGVNPTTVPPAAFPEDAFYRHVFGYAGLTSAYGPLWYVLAGIPVVLAGDGLVANLVAQKLLVIAALLATVVLVAIAAPRFGARPAAAAVVIGWNPLLLWEFAGNGHNDALMVLPLAAAVAAAAWRRWLLVFPLLALSVLVKFTTLLAGPVLLVWLWRRPEAPRRSIILGLVLAALLCLLAYLPFWAGSKTLAFLDRPGMTFILSPATLLYGVLVEPLGAAGARRAAYLVTGLVFAALYGAVLWRAGGPVHALAAVTFDALFVYLVLASWWFWPWYLSWLAPMAAWRAGGRRAWVFALFTCAALFTYLYWWSDPPERARLWYIWYALITAGVFALPGGLWLAGCRARAPRQDGQPAGCD